MQWFSFINGLMQGISLGLAIYNLTDVIRRRRRIDELYIRNLELEQTLRDEFKSLKEKPDKIGFRQEHNNEI